MRRHSRHGIGAAVLAAGLVFAWTGAQAMWARLTEAQLFETSDIIVVGEIAELTSVRPAPGGGERRVGVLRIESVLKGDAALSTVWIDLPQPGRPRSGTDIAYAVGQEGLWYLRLRAPRSAGIYAADHPQRFVPIAVAGPRIDALRARSRR